VYGFWKKWKAMVRESQTAYIDVRGEEHVVNMFRMGYEWDKDYEW
jgi:hypothetical protein